MESICNNIYYSNSSYIIDDPFIIMVIIAPNNDNYVYSMNVWLHLVSFLMIKVDYGSLWMMVRVNLLINAE